MPYILGAVIIIALLVAYQKRKSDTAMKNATERFWDREREANVARRRDISALPYIDIPYDVLPLSSLSDSEEYTASVASLRSSSGKKILDLSGMTNTDLKLAYGAANLPALMECEQNYLVLVRTLTKMATLLFEAGLEAEAESVLRFSLEIGSDIRANYELLAQIYRNQGEYRKLDALIAQAEKLNSPSRDTLLTSLYRIKNQPGGSEVNIDDLLPPT